jgi:hypothetical protein
MKNEIIEEAKKVYQKALQDNIDLSFYNGVNLGAELQQEQFQTIVPFDAYDIEVFKIKADENGNLFAYIGYKITNGNFHFNVVPFTEPQQDKNKYSESEVIILLNKFGSKVYGDYTRNTTMEEFCDRWFEQNKKK